MYDSGLSEILIDAMVRSQGPEGIVPPGSC